MSIDSGTNFLIILNRCLRPESLDYIEKSVKQSSFLANPAVLLFTPNASVAELRVLSRTSNIKLKKYFQIVKMGVLPKKNLQLGIESVKKLGIHFRKSPPQVSSNIYVRSSGPNQKHQRKFRLNQTIIFNCINHLLWTWSFSSRCHRLHLLHPHLAPKNKRHRQQASL